MPTLVASKPEGIAQARREERRACIGLVLAAVGRAKLSGQHDVANVLDALATRMEWPLTHGERPEGS